MGKYLKKFELTAQYEEYINSAIASLPNISIVKDNNNMIHFNHNYLKFTAEENNSTIKLNAATSPDIKYSLNGGEWIQWDYRTITLKVGDTVRIKGNNINGFSKSVSSYNKFQMTGKIGASGNIMSLLYGDGFEENLTIPCAYCFYCMFQDCSSLTTAPELPATTLTNNCYEAMFLFCSSLTSAPVLPATTLAISCYSSMFYSCRSLTTAPELPATTLADACYQSMFQYCPALTTAPDLPATTLTRSCYTLMFNGCTSLTTAPVLPAKTLAISCYQNMFVECPKLNYIKMLATDISASDCLYNWVNGVASTGTFVKNPNMTSLSSGSDVIPSGWTVQDAVPNYLKFTAEVNNSTISLNAATSPDIKYSLNGGEWIQWNYSAITLNTGDTVRMKGNNSNGFSTSISSYNQFSMTGKISASGNIMSLLYALLYEDYFEGKLTIPCKYCFYRMFENCAALTTVPELPATNLTPYCYQYMFQGCTSLTAVPVLPAKTLVDGCYYGMFSGCTSLTTTSNLPAETLADYCYREMFKGCTSLTTAPELPVQTLTKGCYSTMFYGCSSLSSITMLATDISASLCLSNWVNNVASTGTFIKDPNMTSLKTGISGIPTGWTVQNPAPNYLKFTAEENNSTISLNSGNSPDIKYSLNGGDWKQWDYNAITLNAGDTVRMKGNNSNGFNTGNSANNQFSMTGKISASGNIMSLLYDDDFKGKLIIPCTNCFQSIFKNCTALTTAPELPATTLTDHCYHEMFAGCTALTVAPELPATTLTQWCYYQMFFGCTSLTTSPELPATILTLCCYGIMFNGCSKLNYIKMLAINISAPGCLDGWVYNVASTGTFIKHPNMTSLPSGPSGIPNGWTVQDEPVEDEPVEDVPVEDVISKNYLKFTAEEDNSIISLYSVTSPDIKYSLNGGKWTQWNYRDIPLNTGDTVYMKGTNSNGFNINDEEYNYFEMTGTIAAGGNIMSLLYEDDFEERLTIPCAYCFYGLFYDCSSLTSAPELPATTLTDYCYSNMFVDCASLTTAPELPATTLTSSCYDSMFRGCRSLTTAPDLPATTLTEGCYYEMFYGCTSLETAPELPATTLTDYCYQEMFYGCTSLTTAPVLPAKTLVDYCYYRMFGGCTKLNYIKMLATNIKAYWCLDEWVYGVSSTGTFVKHKNMSSLKTGYSGIPSGWTVQNAA